MKVRVNVTVKLTPEQIKILHQLAESYGHGFDNTPSKRKIIQRYLTSLVTEAVIYCHEKVDRD